MAVISCLTGAMVKKHPTLDIWCRDDGAVLLPSSGPHRKKGEWTYGCNTNWGYKVVGYCHKQYFVHNLVLETFYEKPAGTVTCDHINRKRDDNRLCNLRWADKKTQADNRQYVIDAPDYGCRSCDDVNAYRRGKYAQNETVRTKAIKRAQDYYRRRVADGWRLTHHGWVRA